MNDIFIAHFSFSSFRRKMALAAKTQALKLVICAFICLASLAYAPRLHAQSLSKDIKIENKTVAQALKTIEKNSSYSFFYNNNQINLKRRVSVRSTNRNLLGLLDKIFAGTGVKYKVIDKKIVLSTAISNEEKKAPQSASHFQAAYTIKGKVTDASGEALIGANVSEKQFPNKGIITDINGNFELKVSQKNIQLVVSYVGYDAQTLIAKAGNFVNIVMKENAKILDEVVVVGYGTQRKGNLTGSVSSVKSDKINVAPVSSVSNALAGVLPGLVVKQESGLPGGDGASLRIRGFDAPLVIVDGIERSFDDIDAAQIESISILKDGAASIYGARAGNGVVLVTTKRGVSQKPTITVNSSYTVQGITNWVRPASSYERAVMEREEHLQSGLPESTCPWTEEDIELFRTGLDPENYPNTNWFKAAFRKYAPQQNHNISVRGGSDKIKYMGYFGYNEQETMVRKGGGGYKRYNLESNMDANITKDLKVSIDFATTFENRDYPIRGLFNGANTWQDLYTSSPFYHSSYSDPTKIAWAGIDVGSILVTTNMNLSGYNKNHHVNLKTSATLAYDLHKLIPGLQAKAFVNYEYDNTYIKMFQKPVTFYIYNIYTDNYDVAGAYYQTASLNESWRRDGVLTLQGSLNYDHAFGDHHITALALCEMIDYHSNGTGAGRVNFLTPLIEEMYAGDTEGMTTTGWESEMGRVSYVGRLNYDYKGRYLIETILRADASAKFAKGHRWGYFPSVSLGWNIGDEPWMQKLKFIDNAKIRMSYGESGNDAVGNFQYLTGYSISSRPYMLNGKSNLGLSPLGLANPWLTWEKMKIYNIGLDFSLWRHQLYGTFEMFRRFRKGIPGQRYASLPSTIGVAMPTENLNNILDRGFELSLGTTGKWHGLKYDLSGNISYSRAMWDKYDEPEYTDPDQIRLVRVTGSWTDRFIGYKSAGLFTSQDEIDKLDYVYSDLGTNKNLRPGDVKYLDMNGDHVLDWRDQQVLGKGSMPHWMYGINFSLQYKNFDLMGLFQGAFGYTTYVNALADVTSLKYKLRWTEATNDPHADVPRLGGSSSNGWSSDYWGKSTSYIRLKNMSIGYSIPNSVLNKIGIEKIRLFVAGTNLWTLSSLHKYGIDPEAVSGNITRYYPQQRTYSFGVNISL
jgi:TonB-linked SusC/RagA family outer membrane protein